MSDTLYEQPWMEHANCRGVDADLMFPERGASHKAAKAVCAGCSVRDACLQWALREGFAFGVFGGTSERERRRLRKAAPKICLHCHGEFRPANRHERICSDTCRAARDRARADAYRKRAS